MDLIAFGTIFLEIVFGDVPSLPAPGEEVFADEFAISCGGGAVTAASAASRIGASAGMSTLLGEDLGSRVAEEYCHRAGVDLSACQRVTGPAAGITVVMNYAGDRAFLSYLPPRAQTESREHERWLEVLRRERPAWCYLHAHRGMAGLIQEARDLGIRVAVDVALNDIAADPAAVLACARLADVFLPNSEELLRLTGSHLARRRDRRRGLLGPAGGREAGCQRRHRGRPAGPGGADGGDRGHQAGAGARPDGRG